MIQLLSIFCLFFLLPLQGCTSISPQVLQRLRPSVVQAIIVHPSQRNSTQANLTAWQKGRQGWHRLWSVGAVIGRNGLATVGQKKEGDGKTPWGVYPLGPAFGYAPSFDTGMTYQQMGDLDFWVDDPQSMQYNQLVRGTPNARSFERMKRSDNLYQFGIVIGYNEHPIVKGAGSAIFMHIWRKYYSPTAGCVALNQRYLRKIVHWLKAQDQPVIILE